KVFTVGEVAARAGVAVSALHFYERKGLIRSHRTSGNQRRYDRDVLRRLAVIRIANELGIPLGAVGQAMATLPQGREPTKAEPAALRSGCAEPASSHPDRPGTGPPAECRWPGHGHAAAGTRADQGGLGGPVEPLEGGTGAPHHAPEPAARRTDRLHRLRLPVD